jgi:hypothetical protein
VVPLQKYIYTKKEPTHQGDGENIKNKRKRLKNKEI